MKKNYFIAILALIANFVNAQIEPTSYRGAFAPAPTAMWTDSWTNYDPQNTVYPATTVTVNADITANTTWATGQTVALSGLIYVRNNATLTIQPGVVIKGAGAGAGLVITKGSKINAVGTASQPIVFTSNNAPGSRNKGDWGGVILLGKGAFNINNGVNNIEGITASVYTEYGGGTTPDLNDNSGILKYVRIEFGGYVYAPNNEINGLTLGAVGKGTTIDYVQVSYANDDAFEWFGGNVNCKHLVSFRNLDDDFDTDNGFSGTVQFALAIRDPQIADNPSVSTSEGFESDNNASGTLASPFTSAIFTNCTLIGPSYRVTLPNGGTLATGFKRGARIRRASQLKIFNSLFMDFQEGLHVDGVASENAAVAGTLKFKNNILAGIVTTSKVLQVTSPGTITVGNDPSFNMTNWYTASGNSTVANNSGLLTSPYNTSDATTYTGLDYRPASGSIVESGADFTDSAFNGLLSTPLVVVNPIEFTSYRGAFAPAPTAMWTTGWTNYDPQNTVYSATGITVSGEITTNTIWTTGNTYLLQGLTYVKNGATLTIQPGVTIRGAGAGSALIITKGAKINAVGTATSPIVFTSNNAVGSRNKGDWGGVILLGKGSFNINNGVNNIEGITASTDTEFGGGLTPDDADNSGTLKYVRIEFGGYVYAPNSEINGLTFGAVGSGTTIDYVQVSYANDDAFEWFGGSVNCKHLVSYRNLDDDFDTDNGYSGKVQFALAIRDPQISDNPSVSTSEGFESDNNASGTTATPYTSAIFTNCTLIGPSYRVTLPNGGTLATGFKRGARIRRASKLSIYNSIFMDFQEGLHIDGVASENNAVAGDLKFKNNIQAGIVTTSKYIQVNAPGTITVGNNPAFNMTTWFADNGNTNLTTNAGILTLPYNTSDATVYTGLDYRPAAGSPALSGSYFTGLVANVAPIVTTPINYCKGAVATALTATLSGGVSLKWYTAVTGGTGVTTAPVPATTTPGSKTYYVSQVYADNSESPRAAIVVNINALPTTPLAIAGSGIVGKYVATTTPVTYSIADVAGATSYLWTAPLGVNIVGGQGTNTVTVNFNNVPAGAGSIGNLAVQAVNAAGCNSVAKTLALTKALPKAPAGLKMYNLGSATPTTAVTKFSKYIGTSTVLTLTAAVSLDATSYVWELPAGVTQVSGGNSNQIGVNFLNVPNGTTFLRIGVKAKNGTGESFTNNSALVPATTSTAKLLSLTAVLPGTPAAVAGQITGLCGGSIYTYAMATPAVEASSYIITAPVGSVVTSASNSSNVSNVLTTSDLTFSVQYPADLASLATKTIVVYSNNGVGQSALSKTLTLSTAMPTIGVLTGGTTFQRCATQTFSVPAIAAATSYTWVPANGAVIVSGQGTNTVVVDFSAVLETVLKTTLKVSATNACAVNSTVKTFTLSTATCPAAKMETTKEVTNTAIQVYPNPATDVFNVDVTSAGEGVITMSIYTINGSVVSTKNLNVTEGLNTVNENISSLSNGVYFVQFVNQTTNETIVKKLVKR
ncbi:T9SS type A sorting domain-containing protein [Flavobacterium sp. XGLA_31]|uniref:T9SS type A sorting domain-containing protein n=1 Tax=Flavobacterium sp. XGLA_31 TaxID=3447666 RepID=UPI003F32D1AD